MSLPPQVRINIPPPLVRISVPERVEVSVLPHIPTCHSAYAVRELIELERNLIAMRRKVRAVIKEMLR